MARYSCHPYRKLHKLFCSFKLLFSQENKQLQLFLKHSHRRRMHPFVFQGYSYKLYSLNKRHGSDTAGWCKLGPSESLSSFVRVYTRKLKYARPKNIRKWRHDGKIFYNPYQELSISVTQNDILLFYAIAFRSKYTTALISPIHSKKGHLK